MQRYIVRELKEHRDASKRILTEEMLANNYGELKILYGFPQRLELSFGNSKGMCNKDRVRLNKNNCSLLLLCHEVAHAVQLSRGYSGKWHSTWHARLTREIIKKVQTGKVGGGK